MDAETTGFVQTPISATDAPANASKLVRAKSAMEKGGNKGVEIVNKIGQRVNTRVSNYAEKSLAKQGQTPPKEVKLGGASTASALSAAKTVVGIGASVAAKIIDSVANNVGDKVAASKTVESMRTAPEGTTKRTVHDLLVSGSVAIARVYLAADHQGRLICESAGNSASQVVGAKYGSEAEHATREGARIVIDSYRIIRFPTRLGATTMLKGALKGATGVDLNSRQ
jgi:Senescence-associated protein